MKASAGHMAELPGRTSSSSPDRNSDSLRTEPPTAPCGPPIFLGHGQVPPAPFDGRKSKGLKTQRDPAAPPGADCSPHHSSCPWASASSPLIWLPSALPDSPLGCQGNSVHDNARELNSKGQMYGLPACDVGKSTYPNSPHPVRRPSRHSGSYPSVRMVALLGCWLGGLPRPKSPAEPGRAISAYTAIGHDSPAIRRACVRHHGSRSSGRSLSGTLGGHDFLRPSPAHCGGGDEN
jgi:hypothetical protein